MSNVQICDFCKDTLEENDPIHCVNVDGDPLDCCDVCFQSPLILSEQRRVRTRKAKAKEPETKEAPQSPKEGKK